MSPLARDTIEGFLSDVQDAAAPAVTKQARELVATAIRTLAEEARATWALRVVRWSERTTRAWLREQQHTGKRARRWRARFDRRVVFALAAPPVDGVTGRAILLAAGVPAERLPGMPQPKIAGS